MKKYKILEVDWDRKHEKAETLMNKMSDDPRTMNLLITFCCDDSNQ